MNKQQVEDIIKKIERNWEKIISNSKLEKGIPKYVFLKGQFESGQILSDEFKTVFQKFYGLNRAGLTPKFIKQYFELLSKLQKETELRDIIQELYQIPNRKGKNTIQFSFATKLLHTIDNSMPIYDSNIRKQLSLDDFHNIKGKEAKIEWCQATYAKLKQLYIDLLDDVRVKKKISELRARLDISNCKVLDFIFWAMPKPKKNKAKLCLR